MRIWVSRAEPGAGETAARLRAAGHEPVIAPVLRVETLAPAIDLSGIDALAFTSRNAVRAFAALSSERALPVHAVGRGTAEAAAEAGFARVTSADGDVRALAAALAKARPGRILHPCAGEPAGDLAALLKGRDVEVRSVPVYRTVPTELLFPPAAEAVLIHSPKAGARVASLLAESPRAIAAYAISEAALAPLAGLGLAVAHAAPFPNEAALLKLLPR